MDQIIYDNIKTAYDKLRSDAEQAKDELVASTYQKYPDLKAIDDKIKNAGLSSIKAVLSHDTTFDFNSEINSLSTQRDLFLKKNNIPLDFDKPHYHCTKCDDTGVVKAQNIRCDCYYNLLRIEELKLTNFEENLKQNSFDGFDLSYYPDECIKGTNITYRKYIESILNTAKKYSRGELSAKNLFFFGASASGKTLIASCIANEFLDKLKSVLYIRSTRLIMIYDNYKFKRNENEDNEVYINRAYDCDLLILDELGNEVINQRSYSYQFLFDLIAERIEKKRATILISELKPTELSSKYTSSFSNKINNNFETIEFIKK